MVLLVNAVDIEAACARPVPGSLLSVGACLYEVAGSGRRGTVLRRFHAVVDWPDGPVFDAPTQAFWRQQAPEALAKNRAHGQPPETVARLLGTFLEECQTLATTRSAAYKIVTDNRQFDVGWLEWFLATYHPGGSTLLKSRVRGSLHDHMVDLRQRVNTLNADLNMRFTWKHLRPSVRADHTPLNDAIVIAERYEYYLHFVHARRYR